VLTRLGIGGGHGDLVGSSDAAQRAAGWTAGWVAGYSGGSRKAAIEGAQAAAVLAAQADEAEVRREAQHTHMIRMLLAAVDAVQARDVLVLSAASDALCDAGVSLAEDVLGVALEDGGLAVRSTLARAFSAVEPDAVVLRACPRDAALLSEALLSEALVSEARVTVRADDTLAPGDFVAEYPAGYLEGRIGTALDRARTALRATTDGHVNTAMTDYHTGAWNNAAPNTESTLANRVMNQRETNSATREAERAFEEVTR
jgi:flagellar assembly protein FliH